MAKRTTAKKTPAPAPDTEPKSRRAAKSAPETPAPASSRKKGEAPADLKWEQHGKDTWLAPDPDGDTSVAGGRIKMTTNRWLADRSNPDPDPSYFVYRDGKYLGSDSTLAAAQRRARYREMAARALADTTHGGLPAFLEISDKERALERARSRATPAPARTAATLPDDPALATAVRAAQERDAIGRQRRQAKAERRATKEGSHLDDDSVIEMLAKENPRKPGSGAHARFDVLMRHGGKTVGEYKAAGGNTETLENAITAGRAKLREKD